MMTRGVFLSLDGLDGCGKTTQCRLLADWLLAQGRQVTMCRDPGGTPVGDRIRGLLLDPQSQMTNLCEMFLYMASRAQLTAEIIRPALERGEVVVADRYLLANVAYQGYAGGLPPERLWEVGALATGGLRPDLTMILDVPPEVSWSRKGRRTDRVESRDAGYFEMVRGGFLAEAAKAPAALRVIDANHSVEEVHLRIQEEVNLVLGGGARA